MSENKYVVILSIGPVQSMIASARRSRDLWSGSWLLSELAKSCAKFLKENGAELIFPYIANDSDLMPNSEFSVGNKIQAKITANHQDELETMLKNAKQAVQNRYKEEAQKAFDLLRNPNDIRKTLWDNQINDFVEVQWAWAKIIDDDYIKASQKVGAVLASRKNTRDFKPLATDPFNNELRLPKSSLDGLRETVLKENVEKQNSITRKQLSLAPSEQLDASGVIKRLGFDKKAEQFTPISRVMADAWILQIAEKKPNLLAEIIKIYEELAKLNVVSRVTGNKDKNEKDKNKQSIYHAFPFDAQLLYRSRLDAELNDWKKIRDNAKNSDEFDNAEKVVGYLTDLKKLLNDKELKGFGEPYRYGVLLLADGDRMGELLDKANNKEHHQNITQALSNFAIGVADIMREYRGHCIYAGGDDVLGFVPLDKAYNCANALQKSFAESLKTVADDLKAENNPTLSVGLAICHLMTPLGVVRELADKAEKIAKGNDIDKKDEIPKIKERRNALGLLLSVRGGSDINLRFNWDDEKGLESFKKFVEYYQDKSKEGGNSKQLPSRVAYDIRAIYLRTKDFAENDADLRKNIQSAELTRMLKQARTDNGQKIADDTIKQLTERAKQIDVDKVASGLGRLADELIVARWFAAKTQKELGKE